MGGLCLAKGSSQRLRSSHISLFELKKKLDWLLPGDPQ
jgi:hypothetical protein